MALTGIQIFKVTPKTNCKDCGNPTCMAFAMKVAQGAVALEKCPHLSPDVIAELSDATAPPMKTITVGYGDSSYSLGSETVLERHEKTFVSKTLFALSVCNASSDEHNDGVFAKAGEIDYLRIGERMYVEFLYVNYVDGKGEDRYIDLVTKAAATDKALILSVRDAAVAEKALEIAKGKNPILNGVNASNYEAFSALATKFGAVLGVSGESLEELHDVVEKIEKLGNKNLILDVGSSSAKDAFAKAVEIRRAAIKGQDRTFGYPSLVNLERLAPGDPHMQTALASLFILKYGSILVMESMTYAQALPLYALRQNIYTDPQKPMRVEPGIYPLNGADENSVVAITVDFALSYFVISGELERSGVPVNLIIPDAGGYSVLTSWAAGKFSAGSIAKFIEEFEIESKIKSRKLVLPGKVAVLKGELEDKLPGWEIIVGPNEAIQAVKFFKEI
ncbi:MAG: acetyl-CoA decarbonylase/synthase complex subunit gamma [Eubacteriaceae bacterium]|jgi:acetyl-CoA decarbonylase/synthase complex subunit gamma|nr:acetyl-CoA decarbonylase/synthase complex subunit gamma [Eubacteriaceae bacterium]